MALWQLLLQLEFELPMRKSMQGRNLISARNEQLMQRATKRHSSWPARPDLQQRASPFGSLSPAPLGASLERRKLDTQTPHRRTTRATSEHIPAARLRLARAVIGRAHTNYWPTIRRRAPFSRARHSLFCALFCAVFSMLFCAVFCMQFLQYFVYHFVQ